MTEKEGSDKNKRYSERLPDDVPDKLPSKSQSDEGTEEPEEILSAFLWNEGREQSNNSKKNNKEQTHARVAVSVIVIAVGHRLNDRHRRGYAVCLPARCPV